MILPYWFALYAFGAHVTAYVLGRLGDEDEPGGFEILIVLLWPVAWLAGILFLPYFSGKRQRAPKQEETQSELVVGVNPSPEAWAAPVTRRGSVK